MEFFSRAHAHAILLYSVKASKSVMRSLRRNMIYQGQILILNAKFLSSLPLVLFLFSRIFLYFSLKCGSRNIGNDEQSGYWEDHVAAQPVICHLWNAAPQRF